MAVFTDDFNRADSTSSIGPGWSLGYSAVAKVGILSNQVYQLSGVSASADLVARRTGATYTGDQFAEIVVKALPSEIGTWVPGPAVKVSDSGFSQYGVSYKLDGTVVVRKTGTAVITTSTTLTVNDVFRLEWIASTSTLTLKKNGATLGTPYVDGSPLTGNNIGLYSYALVSAETGWRLDDFGGGDLVASTAYTLTADAGSYSLTGQAATLTYTSAGAELTGEAGAFTITGVAAGLRKGYKLQAEVGSFTLDGEDAARDMVMSAGAGSFGLTGVDATLTYTPAAGSYTLSAETGVFTLAGKAAGVPVGRNLPASAGSFVLDGQAAAFAFGRKLPASAGSFTFSGQDATFALDANTYTLTAEAGAFVLSGIAATLTSSAVTVRVLSAAPSGRRLSTTSRPRNLSTRTR